MQLYIDAAAVAEQVIRSFQQGERQSCSAVFKSEFGTVPCFRCPDYDSCAVFYIPFVF